MAFALQPEIDTKTELDTKSEFATETAACVCEPLDHNIVAPSLGRVGEEGRCERRRREKRVCEGSDGSRGALVGGAHGSWGLGAVACSILGAGAHLLLLYYTTTQLLYYSTNLLPGLGALVCLTLAQRSECGDADGHETERRRCDRREGRERHARARLGVEVGAGVSVS